MVKFVLYRFCIADLQISNYTVEFKLYEVVIMNENIDNTNDKKSKKPGYDIMTVMSTTLAFLILTAAAAIIFVLAVKQTSGNDAVNADTDIQGIEVDNTDAQPEITNDEVNPPAEEARDIDSETSLREHVVGTLTIVSDVNIRDNPDTDESNVIRVAKAEETFEYIGLADNGNWYIVLLDDSTSGYVYKGYVSVN